MSESADPTADLPADLPQTPPIAIKPAAPNGARITLSGPVSDVQAALNGGGGLTPAPTGFKRYEQSIPWLNNAALDPQRANYRIEIVRTGPAVWQGVPIPLAKLPSVSIMSFEQLKEYITSVAGGGAFRATVVDESGMTQRVVPITIETAVTPPKVVEAQMIAPVAIQPSHLLPGAVGARAHVAPGPLAELQQQQMEVEKLRLEDQRLRAEEQVKERQASIRKKDREAKREEQQERRIEEQEHAAPIKALESKLETLADKLSAPKDDKTLVLIVESMKHSQTQQMQMMQLMMQQSKEAAAQQMAMMQAAQNQQSQLMATLFQSLNSSGAAKANESIEAAKLQIEAQSKMFEMVAKINGGSNSKMDKLFETIITQQLTSNRNSTKEVIELLEMGRRQTLELLERRENDDDDDSMTYDPKAGVLGNLGKLIFGALTGLMRGAGGPAGIAQVLAALNKSHAGEVSQNDLSQLAAQLEQQAPPQLANTVQQAQLPMRTPLNPTGQPAPKAMHTPSAVNPGHAQPPAPAAVTAADPVMYEDDELRMPPPVPVQPVSAPVAQPVMQNAPVLNENKLMTLVTDAMEQAIDDLKEGVREHNWFEFAVAKWPRAFLDAFSQAQIMQRIEMLQANCDPGVWQELYSMLGDQTQPEHYQNFARALDMLVQDHLNPQPVG